jgi:hypothetical protein
VARRGGRNRTKVQGWVSQLDGDRLEIYLKVENAEGIDSRKIRASGPTADMYELVDWFEAKTGMRVNVPNRPHTGPKPMAGQMELTMGELPSEDQVSRA